MNYNEYLKEMYNNYRDQIAQLQKALDAEKEYCHYWRNRCKGLEGVNIYE